MYIASFIVVVSSYQALDNLVVKEREFWPWWQRERTSAEGTCMMPRLWEDCILVNNESQTSEAQEIE
jgi:hypothetical protein